jgi:CRP-like cAMP-binding protein
MGAMVFTNVILKALDSETIGRLLLQPVTFPTEFEIEFPGQSIHHLYFVEEGMASITTTFSDGAQVEVGMCGYESVIGVSALMGTKRSLNRIYTQIAGRGYCCPLAAAKAEFQRDGIFRSLALRYVQTQLLQAMQSAGCNAKHEVSQRLARWLLICADRAQTTTFKMSHEYLSHMLGAARPTVSQAAAILKQEGLIEYTRGVIHIPDVTRLEVRACECYQVIKEYLNNFADMDSESPGKSRV